MSISGNHILEINFIKDILKKSDKPELVEVLETIIKVADKIIEFEDNIDEEDIIYNFNKSVENGEMAVDSSSEEDSDEEYFPPIKPTVL